MHERSTQKIPGYIGKSVLQRCNANNCKTESEGAKLRSSKCNAYPNVMCNSNYTSQDGQVNANQGKTTELRR